MPAGACPGAAGSCTTSLSPGCLRPGCCLASAPLMPPPAPPSPTYPQRVLPLHGGHHPGAQGVGHAARGRRRRGPPRQGCGAVRARAQRWRPRSVPARAWRAPCRPCAPAGERTRPPCSLLTIHASTISFCLLGLLPTHALPLSPSGRRSRPAAECPAHCLAPPALPFSAAAPPALIFGFLFWPPASIPPTTP